MNSKGCLEQLVRLRCLKAPRVIIKREQAILWGLRRMKQIGTWPYDAIEMIVQVYDARYGTD